MAKFPGSGDSVSQHVLIFISVIIALSGLVGLSTRWIKIGGIFTSSTNSGLELLVGWNLFVITTSVGSLRYLGEFFKSSPLGRYGPDFARLCGIGTPWGFGIHPFGFSGT